MFLKKLKKKLISVEDALNIIKRLVVNFLALAISIVFFVIAPQQVYEPKAGGDFDAAG